MAENSSIGIPPAGISTSHPPATKILACSANSSATSSATAGSGLRTARATRFAITFISGSRMPWVVTAAVPTLMPEESIGLAVS